MITHKTNQTLVNFFACIIFYACTTSFITAQSIWQVDSSIEKMSVVKIGELYVLNVTIKSFNDDDARSPKLIINLPRNCYVEGIQTPDGFEDTSYQIFGNESQVFPSPTTHIDSYINFDLKNLDKNTYSTFKISFQPTTDGLRPESEASAFIYSLTPEAKKSNNFKTIVIN